MRIEANEMRSLLRLAYGRKDCDWALNEDYFRRELYLTAVRGGERANVSDLRFDLRYIENGQLARYHYVGDEGSLTLQTRTSWSEMLLTDEDQLRFRGDRPGDHRFSRTGRAVQEDAPVVRL